MFVCGFNFSGFVVIFESHNVIDWVEAVWAFGILLVF